MKDLQYEVWNSTYRYQNETIEETWRRVAKALAEVEENKEYWEEKFYENLKDFKCTLGGRILSNAGTSYKGTSLLNCFVSGRCFNRNNTTTDSINGIYNDLLEQALILKSEGGWGSNFCLRFDEKLFVKRDDEEIFIEIEKVKKGDKVISSDGEWHSVEETMTSEKDNMIELVFENDKIIVCTDDHPFLVKRDNEEIWVEAKDILDSDDIVNI